MPSKEIGVNPHNLVLTGTMHFYLSHDSSFDNHTHIFTSTDWDGIPHETEEMRPQWFHEDNIPYTEMWPDDHLWMPLLLAGKYFTGSFTVGPHDELISQSLVECTARELLKMLH